MDRYQYLALLLACLAITAPLELTLRARVYAQPRRLVRAVVPVAVLFLLWDAVAVHRGLWWFSDRFVTGWTLPFRVPVEELLFMVVIPVCSLLTYEGVGAVLPRRTPRRGGRRA
jgi:lycopene cyclase domain-containing protein